eukprot:521655-Prymnesium_polylepis.1
MVAPGGGVGRYAPLRCLWHDGRWWRPGAVSGTTRPCGASGTRYASMRALHPWPMAYDAPGG